VQQSENVRDDEIRRAFTEANPWWRAAAAGSSPTAWTAAHRLLQDRARFDIGYRTKVFDDLAREPVGDRLVLITGPRRVGKSVALLDLAAALCARLDVDPRQVVHLPPAHLLSASALTRPVRKDSPSHCWSERGNPLDVLSASPATARL
jgi:hypothetical protein